MTAVCRHPSAPDPLTGRAMGSGRVAGEPDREVVALIDIFWEERHVVLADFLSAHAGGPRHRPDLLHSNKWRREDDSGPPRRVGFRLPS